MSSFLAFLTILLSQVCLDECPFRYDIMGGSLNISLSNGCYSNLSFEELVMGSCNALPLVESFFAPCG